MIDREILREHVLYEPDTGIFRRVKNSGGVKSGSVSGTIGSHGYLTVSVCGKNYLAHRLAILDQTGDWPLDIVDHVDGDKTNNRYNNLRQCSKSENGYNMKRRPSRSGIKSVEWHEGAGKWRVRMEAGGKRHHIGFFSSLADAERSAIEARLKLHGAFARNQ